MFQLTSSSSVIRTDDGSCIPADPANFDWQQYQSWLAAGNLPNPYTPPAVDLAAKIDALWRAADAYTSKYISGVAIGLLTICVMQGKPKAMAISAWSSSVWDAYYQRKALVTATSTDNLDFSALGPMPYTVPELRAELGM